MQGNIMNVLDIRISAKLNTTLDEGNFDSLDERLSSASYCARTSLESNFIAYNPVVEINVDVNKGVSCYTIKANNLNLSHEVISSLVRSSFVDEKDMYYNEFLAVELVDV